MDYSYNISKHFIENGHECYIDQLSSLTPGKKLPSNIKNAVKASNSLVIIGSVGAADSEPIQQEVELFLDYNINKPIIPISFNRSIEKAIWYNRIEGLAIVEDELSQLKLGQPSADVLERIQNALTFTKKSNRLRRIAILVSIFTLMLIGVAIWFSIQVSSTTEELSKASQDLKASQDSLAVNNSKLQNSLDSLATLTQSLDSSENNLLQSRKTLTEVNKSLNSRQYELDVTQTFELFRQGSEGLSPSNASSAKTTFNRVIQRMKNLNLDPLIGSHALLAADLIDETAEQIIDIEPAAAFIKVSLDDKYLLVVYDHQDFGGNPDIEDIPGWTSFVIYDLGSGNEVLREPIESNMGSYLYASSKPDAFLFKESEYIILCSFYEESISIDKHSLTGDSLEELEKLPDEFRGLTITRRKEVYNDFISDEELYEVHPDEGIDEYSRRLVGKVEVTSSNEKLMLIGTYEGRILLIDLETGYIKKEIFTYPIFSADFDSQDEYVYVADEESVWKISSGREKSIVDISQTLLLQDNNFWKSERLLDVSISTDGSIVSLATTHRLFAFQIHNQNWTTWEFKNNIESVADLEVDIKNKRVILVSENGSLIVANLNNPIKFEYEHVESDKSVVAWIDQSFQDVWLSPIQISGEHIEVNKLSLDNYGNLAKEIPIKLQGLSTDFLEQSNYELHSISRVGNSLALIYGDSESIMHDFVIMPGQLHVQPLDLSTKPTNHILFEPTSFVDNIGEEHWSIERVEKIMSISSEGRIQALTELHGSFSISLEGDVDGRGYNIGANEIIFSEEEAYVLGLQFEDETSHLVLSIEHLLRDVQFNYNVPWRFENEPDFVSIGKNGRKVVIANRHGSGLILDASLYDQ